MTSKDDSVKRQDELEQDAPKLGVSRRQFLGAGAMVVAAAAFPSYAKADSSTAPQKTIAALPPKDRINGFPQPCTAPIGTDVKPTALNVSIENIPITLKDNQGQPYQVSNPRRVYNDQLPGPTFKLKPGDKLRLTLINDLPPNPPETIKNEMNTPEKFNTTNLHFHGFHVSPSSIDAEGKIVPTIDNNGEITLPYDAVLSSDDVLFKLNPRENLGDPATTHEYSVLLPDDHPPGTHWYHSHYHGSTGIQVVDGMVGVLIVEEPEDQKISVDQDLLWVVQELPKSGTKQQGSLDAAWDTQVYKCNPPGGSPSTFLVNGEYQPTLTMRPGELHRWRFLNATGTPQGFMTLKFQKKKDDGSFEPVNVVLMAVDGISLYEKQLKPNWEKSEWDMSPGNRADFLVQLDEGVYQVIRDNFSGVPTLTITPQVLAYVQVEGDPIPDIQKLPIPEMVPGEIPAALQTISDKEVTKSQTMEFTIPPGKKGCGVLPVGAPLEQPFLMDNQEYDPRRIDRKVDLGTAEEWTISNTTFAAHPFHIHVNPFQVVDDNGNPTEGFWRDTIAIPPNSSLKIRHRFQDFPGAFVIHCHILIHEDYGMMQNVLVAGTGVGPAGSSLSVEKPKGLSSRQPAQPKTPSSGGGKIPGSGGGKRQLPPQ